MNIAKKELGESSNSALAIPLVSPRFFIGTNKTDLYSDMTIRLPATRITQLEPDLCAKISHSRKAVEGFDQH